MRMLICVAALAAVLVMSGCAGLVVAPVVPGYGFIFSDYKAPLDTNGDPTQVGTKKGEASTEDILGWVITGDASVQTAAQNGGISKIHHVDYKFRNILGIYAKFTTIVYGE